MKLRLLKWLSIVVILAFGVVVAYAAIGDFSAPGTKTVHQVTINVD